MGDDLVRRADASNPPALYTAAEAAALLRVKQSWLERQAAARRIPFTMLAGSYRFTGDHLVQIVRMHEKKPAAETWQPAERGRPRAIPGSPSPVDGVTPLRARARIRQPSRT